MKFHSGMFLGVTTMTASMEIALWRLSVHVTKKRYLTSQRPCRMSSHLFQASYPGDAF